MLGALADVTRNGSSEPSVRAAARAALAQMPPSAPATSEPFSACALLARRRGVAAVVVGDERGLLPDDAAADVELGDRQLRAVDEVRPRSACAPEVGASTPKETSPGGIRRPPWPASPRGLSAIFAAERRSPSQCEKREGAGNAGAPDA